MKKNKKRFVLSALLLLCAVWMLAVPVSAKVKYKNQWVTTSKGKTYYYDKNGKKLKGMQKIGRNYYYFDSKCVQRTGWRKIKNSYYFFNIGTKSKGYRVKSKTVNGVKLAASGKAKVKKSNKRKLALLTKAAKTVQGFTNDKMTKKQKLRKAFDYAKNHLRSYNRGGFQSGGSWDVFYAGIAFDTRRADCYSYAAYFAYLANAVGYKATVVSSGGHGWAEIKGKVYDPNWSKYSRIDSYFGMSYDLSGVGGRPSYKRNRVYLKTV